MINHTGTENLETDRLLLRKFEYMDAESMLRNWIADPLIQSNYGEPVYSTEKEVHELLTGWISQYKNKSFYRWAIILKETGENIGQIAFCRVYDEYSTAEVEYCIGTNFWGKGYAPEALTAILKYSFEKPCIEKLEAFHRIQNPASGRVLQKAAMRKADNVKRFELLKEQPSNEVCYALTRSEWLKRPTLVGPQ